jgi:hypothetical protein
MSYRLLLHVDAQGQARLLQRVLLAWQGTNTTDTNRQYALYSDESKVPASASEVYRLSSVAFPLIAPVSLAGELGYALFGRVDLGYDDPVNPFKHAYHPDHDNLDERFSTNRLPAGVESFQVARDLVFNFYVTRQTESGAFVPPGPVLEFNGTNSSLAISGGTNELRLANAFTVMAWVRADRPSARNGYLFSFGNNTNHQLYLRLEDTTGRMTLGVTAGTGQTQITTTNAFPTNTWVHVTAVDDGAGRGFIYWNAAPVAQGSLLPATDLARTNLFFGRGPSNSGGFFAGRIYDVAIWGDARTAEEVFGDMWLSWGDPAEDDHLLAYFQATEGHGDTLSDVSGQARTARLLQVAWNSSEAAPMPFWGIGETSGEYRETITGLRRTPIILSGSFSLQRVNRNPVLN